MHWINDKRAWYNPFHYIAGGKALAAGLLFIVAAATIGTFSKVWYPGVLDIKVELHAPWHVHLITGLIPWAATVGVLYLMAVALSPSRVRLLDMAGTDFTLLSDSEMMRKQIRSENLYLINAGLDILYMAGGAWMIHAAGNNEKRHDMLKGYGQAVILQGAFLFLFDLTKFAIQYNHRLNFTETTTNLGLTGNGLTLSIGF